MTKQLNLNRAVHWLLQEAYLKTFIDVDGQSQQEDGLTMNEWLDKLHLRDDAESNFQDAVGPAITEEDVKEWDEMTATRKEITNAWLGTTEEDLQATVEDAKARQMPDSYLSEDYPQEEPPALLDLNEETLTKVGAIMRYEENWMKQQFKDRTGHQAIKEELKKASAELRIAAANYDHYFNQLQLAYENQNSEQ